MNSESLRKRFPETYANFFIGNDLVASAPFSFHWGPGSVGERQKLLRTRVKIPLRCYAGLRSIPGKDVRFGEALMFDQAEGKFKSVAFEKVNKESAATAAEIRAYLDAAGYAGGVEIAVLSEAPRGYGLGFSGSFGAAVAAGALVLAGKFSAKDLTGSEFEGSPMFKKLHNCAWKLDFIPRYGNTSGENAYLALAPVGMGHFLCETFDVEEGPSALNAASVHGRIVRDHSGKPIHPAALPVDFCVVYSGLPTDTRQVEMFKGADRRALEGCAVVAKDLLTGEDGKTKKFYVGKYAAKGASPYDAVVDAMLVLNIKTAETFQKLTKEGSGSSAVDELIENANLLRGVAAVAERQANFAEELAFRFRAARKADSERVGIMPCYTGKVGGSYVVVMRPGESRDTLDRALEGLRTLYPQAAVEYASWIDGEPLEGAKVEQHAAGGVHSPMVPKDTAVFRDGNGRTYAASYADIIKKETKGLLFDTVTMKVLLNGEQLTSKDIPSQSTAVEIFTRLLEKDDREVLSSNLPASSYARDKGLMAGKVIMPLKTFVEKATGKEIDLRIRGTSSSYSISLGACGIPVGTVSRR